VTYDDWRLPTTVDREYVSGDDGTTTAGFNITSSEMGYMFYVNLGNKGWHNIDGSLNPSGEFGLKNTGPFVNLKKSINDQYWSDTFHNNDWTQQWFFNFETGEQVIRDGYYDHGLAWAVRDGDVAAVPIPGAILLLGSGLIGLAGFRRKFKKA
jgi:hypothetical protein